MKIQDIFDRKVSDYLDEVKDYIKNYCLSAPKYSTPRYSVFFNSFGGEENTLIVRDNDGDIKYAEITTEKFEKFFQEKIKNLTENNIFGLSELKIKLTVLEECLRLIVKYKSPSHCRREHL